MHRSVRTAVTCLAAAAALLGTAAVAARELAAARDAFVEVEVATVGLAERGGGPVVLLREPSGGEVVPIFIGPGQARAILLALRDREPPRPMTHDLLGSVIGSLDARLERIYVDDLVDGTFLGMLELSTPARDEPVRVDARPSDAIALALRTGASIHVAPAVLEEARLIDYRGLEAQRQVVTAVGITVMAPDEQLRQALDLPDRRGLVVTEAVGAARGVGLRAGALLLAVNDQEPDSPMDFLRLVGETPDGERVAIRYWRDGEVREVELPTRVPERAGSPL